MKKVLGREVKFFLDAKSFVARDGRQRGTSRVFRLVDALPDGTYDVMIVDVEIDEEQHARIDVVLTAGSHRGEVASLRASSMGQDPVGLMGLPARLEVKDGTPRLKMD
jgi:uncharacterized protein YcnI